MIEKQLLYGTTDEYLSS